MAAIAKLREALQTLPFFGTGKVIWLRDCNFLGDERAASAQAVTETLAELAEELKTFAWSSNRDPAFHQRGQGGQAQNLFQDARQNRLGRKFRGLVGGRPRLGGARGGRGANGRARPEQGNFRRSAGGTGQPRRARTRASSTMKSKNSACSPATGGKLKPLDVTAVCARNKTARAFALGDALGDRDLPRLLRRLDEELWEVKFDSQKSEIGLLYGLDRQSARDAVAEGNAARRLDQARDGLQPVQGATGARAGGQAARRPAVQSAGA